MAENNENIAATVAREARKPFVIQDKPAFIAVPDGYKLQDTEELEACPRRKKSIVRLDDDTGYIDYIKRHGEPATTTIWCNADYEKGLVGYTCILNDHAGEEGGQEWRDHLAHFEPTQSVEWKRWIEKNGKVMDQLEFATFVENNLADIATAKSMEAYSQFSIGIPVFRGSDPYQINARLKYRLNSGKLKFWYELIRADKVMEASAKSMTAKIQEQTTFPIFHGNPSAR